MIRETFKYCLASKGEPTASPLPFAGTSLPKKLADFLPLKMTKASVLGPKLADFFWADLGVPFADNNLGRICKTVFESFPKVLATNKKQTFIISY